MKTEPQYLELLLPTPTVEPDPKTEREEHSPEIEYTLPRTLISDEFLIV